MGNGKFPNMKTLNLANNLLTDTTVALLSKLTQVTTLDLTRNDKITDLTSLTSMTNLKSLKVHPKLEKQKAVLTSGQTLMLMTRQLQMPRRSLSFSPRQLRTLPPSSNC